MAGRSLLGGFVIIGLATGVVVTLGSSRLQLVVVAAVTLTLLGAWLLVRYTRMSKGRSPWDTAQQVRGLRQPGWMTTLLFVLLMSGPPRFRQRDPEASLRGEIDALVLVHLIIWAIGALWVLHHLIGYRLWKRPPFQLSAVHLFAFVLIAFIGLSVFVSPGPGLTAFRTYQLLVMLVFGLAFTQLYGFRATLNLLFWGYGILCIAILVAFLVYPDLVVARDRLRGDYIAPAGAVAGAGLVLLLSGVRKLSRFWFSIWAAVFLTLLALSQTRSAYIAVFAVLFFWVVTRPPLTGMRRFFYLCLTALPILAITGLLEDVSSWMIREEVTIRTLSDRLGLWQHLIDATLRESPLIGLGYYAASRVRGRVYNPGLGTAHSSFVEVFTGAGILGFIVLLAVVLLLGVHLARSMFGPHRSASFAASALFICVLCFAAVAQAIEPGPMGFTFWALVSIAPSISGRHAYISRPRTKRDSVTRNQRTKFAWRHCARKDSMNRK